MVVERNGVVQDDVDLRIIVVVMIQHLINIRLHFVHFPSVALHIAADYGKGLLKMCFFVLPGHGLVTH